MAKAETNSNAEREAERKTCEVQNETQRPIDHVATLKSGKMSAVAKSWHAQQVERGPLPPCLQLLPVQQPLTTRPFKQESSQKYLTKRSRLKSTGQFLRIGCISCETTFRDFVLKRLRCLHNA
eukprot:5692412-Amphidinium_carterae.1